MWRIHTGAGLFRTADAILGFGRRGSPRKLEVLGGGGDGAVERALSLADSSGCALVTISYRCNVFARFHAENRFEKNEPSLPIAAVIVPIAGAAPSELVEVFGIEVVTK